MSKLLEAQAKKIRTIAEKDFTISQTTALNESMRKNINSLTKLHLLLSIKFELLINHMTIQNRCEQTETECEPEPKTKCECEYESEQESKSETELKTESVLENQCCQQKKGQLKPSNVCEPTTYIFKGRCQGEISDQDDFYSNGHAIFQAYVSDVTCEKKELFLSYSAMKGTIMLVCLSTPKNIHAEFSISPCYKTIKIEGTGIIIIRERSKLDIKETGKYTLNVMVENAADKHVTFEMKIEANSNKSFNHWSGKIESQASKVIIEPSNF